MQAAEDFDAFVAIVDAGSISGAARELGVPRATLSRQLARLEERLGVRLLHQTYALHVPSLGWSHGGPYKDTTRTDGD